MNEQDFKSESQKYLDEMMKLYSANKNASVNTISEDAKEKEDNLINTQIPPAIPHAIPHAMSPVIPPVIPPASFPLENEMGKIAEDIADEEINSERRVPESIPNNEDNNSFENRFPEPVIPEFMKTQPSVPIRPNSRKTVIPASEKMPEGSSAPQEETPYTEEGFLKVEVRTGENGIPVPNAAVTVARKNGDKEELIFTGTNDASGTTEKIRLPTPPNSKGKTPESFENYAKYTVSAYAKSFFREVSSEVPVFSGITSIQRFDMIPTPFNYDDNGQSIVFENPEPKF